MLAVWTDRPGEREPFRLGINYWPARTAMTWWVEFDPAEVAEDFERIAASGFDSIRLFLLWEEFQPQPDRVDLAMLQRLVTVADLAGRVRLQIMPTLFTGHMSGVNWIPGWALGGTDRDERFRVVSGGAGRHRRATQLVRGCCRRAVAGTSGGRGRGRPRRRRDPVGVGPRQRELELRRGTRPCAGPMVVGAGRFGPHCR